MRDEHTINLQPGTVIGGKYEIVKCLGSGSMGSVYACKNQVLQGQLVAMKVLFPEVASDAVASARFKNEILAAYEVSHPNVVRAYEYLTDGDLVAYTMEYVGGGDLASKLGSEKRLSISEIVRLLSQMSAGCQAIHDAGIVHRDFKPENILLTGEGNVKIADFGIARNRHGPKLTEHGGVVGTIDYVAPEYMLKSQVDWRSDIYAIGILAYEMVTGESPFKGESVYATMTKRLKTDPEPPSFIRPESPLELDRIILKAMRRDPEGRYQAAEEMYRDLQNLASEYALDNQEMTALGADNFIGDSGHTGATHVSQAGATSVPWGGEGRTSSDGRGARGSGTEVFNASHVEGSGRSAGTQVIDEGRIAASVETDMESGAPYFASEPLVPNYPERIPRDRRGDFRSSGSVHRVRRSVERDSNWGEILALLFAAAVGIGCGFIFLKLFAPSLLAKWYI